MKSYVMIFTLLVIGATSWKCSRFPMPQPSVEGYMPPDFPSLQWPIVAWVDGSESSTSFLKLLREKEIRFVVVGSRFQAVRVDPSHFRKGL